MAASPKDPYFIRYGADSLIKELQSMRAEIDGVREARDIECIHRMRVSSRRLRTRLALFEDILPAKKAPAWRKQMRKLTKALGAARDVDVQLEFLAKFDQAVKEARLRHGIERLELRLGQRRTRLQAKVTKALDRLAAAKTIEDMEKSLRRLRVSAGSEEGAPSEESLARARSAIAPRLEELLGFEIYVERPERAAELHQMRIAAKRLRYAMEVFAPWFPGSLKPELKTAKALQEILGDIHDCDVWISFLPEFLDEERKRTIDYFGHARPSVRLKAGISHLMRDREAFRKQRHADLVQTWDKAVNKGLWKELQERLAGPAAAPAPEPASEPAPEEVPEPDAPPAEGEPS